MQLTSHVILFFFFHFLLYSPYLVFNDIIFKRRNRDGVRPTTSSTLWEGQAGAVGLFGLSGLP